jgi:hypothetical protein
VFQWSGEKALPLVKAVALSHAFKLESALVSKSSQFILEKMLSFGNLVLLHDLSQVSKQDLLGDERLNTNPSPLLRNLRHVEEIPEEVAEWSLAAQMRFFDPVCSQVENDLFLSGYLPASNK